MQEQHYNELQSNLVEALEEPKGNSVREQVAAAFVQLKKNGHLDSLSGEEVTLLYDYRVWRRSNQATSKVFHWKRRTIDTESGEVA